MVMRMLHLHHRCRQQQEEQEEEEERQEVRKRKKKKKERGKFQGKVREGSTSFRQQLCCNSLTFVFVVDAHLPSHPMDINHHLNNQWFVTKTLLPLFISRPENKVLEKTCVEETRSFVLEVQKQDKDRRQKTKDKSKDVVFLW